VTIPQLEAHFAEFLALVLLVLGGVRLVLHEWRQIVIAWRKTWRPRRPVVIPRLSTSPRPWR
jgi:hypothetical protein